MEFRFSIPILSPHAMAAITEWRPGLLGQPIVFARHLVDLPGIEKWLQNAAPMEMGDKVFFQIELVPFPKQQPDPSQDVTPADRKDAMCAVIDAELAGLALEFIDPDTGGVLDVTLNEVSFEFIEIEAPGFVDMPASEDFSAVTSALSGLLTSGGAVATAYVCQEDDDGA